MHHPLGIDRNSRSELVSSLRFSCGCRYACRELELSLEDYLMEGLIDLIESLRYLIKKYAADGKAIKDRQTGRQCLLS